MSKNHVKNEEWLDGYADGLMTAKKVILALSRGDNHNIIDVLVVMADAVRPRKED